MWYGLLSFVVYWKRGMCMYIVDRSVFSVDAFFYFFFVHIVIIFTHIEHKHTNTRALVLIKDFEVKVATSFKLSFETL